MTGIVITVIGLSLVRSGFTDFAGGANAGEALGSPLNLIMGSIVVTVILVLTFIGQPMLRISSPVISSQTVEIAVFLMGCEVSGFASL